MLKSIKLSEIVAKSELATKFLSDTKDKSLVYRLENTITKLNYIGTTCDLCNRFYNKFFGHISRIPLGSTKLYESIRSAGVDNFIVHIEEYCDKDSRFMKEHEYISKFDSYYNGLNSTRSGKDSSVSNLHRFDLKGRVMITNGVVLLRVVPEELNEYLEEGFTTEIGSMMDYSKGMKFFYKQLPNGDYDEIRIPESEVNQAISSGYVKGFSPKRSSSMRGKIVINNGESEIRISADLLDSYQDQGWSLGGLKGNPNRATCKGRIYVKRGSENRFIYPHQLSEYEQQGFTQGRYVGTPKVPSQVGKIWVNNGVESHLIPKENLNEYIDLGYSKGRLKKLRHS